MSSEHYDRNWLTKRDIYRKPEELYLTRYVIFRCKWFGMYVHKFWISDYDVPHDHPWNFISIPLTVGYREHLPDGTSIWRKRFSPKFRTAGEFHWVELEDGPTWTFFMHFSKKREWGFLTEDGWIDNDSYNDVLKESAKGEKDEVLSIRRNGIQEGLGKGMA
jgi:hypothetical protein